MTKASASISYSSSIGATASPPRLNIRHMPGASNPLTTDITAAPGIASASGPLGQGEELSAAHCPTNDDSSWGGSGSLDNSAGAATATLQFRKAADGSITAIASAAPGATQPFTFSFSGLHDGDRIEWA
jgi:hypothetical protein